MNLFFLLLLPFYIYLIFYFFNFIFQKYLQIIYHKKFIDLLEYFLNIAYEMIYKDQITPYSLEGYKVTNDELETLQRNFVKLSIKLIGPGIKKSLILFFGNYETLTTFIITYLQKRMDTDELIDYAKKLQSQDNESQSTDTK